MAEKKFQPLDTARINLHEMRDGKLIPTAPVGVGLLAGSPVAVLLIDALQEHGVNIGPKTAAVVAILISAVSAYLTRGGRRTINRGRSK